MVSKLHPSIFDHRRLVPRGATVVGVFDRAVRELFFLERPHLKPGDPAVERDLRAFIRQSDVRARWVYYPWSHTAVCVLPEDLYFKVRTARNRNLITEREQQSFRRAIVGVAGLSVGSAVVSALVISGGPKILKIADFDVVELSNLNRIKANLTDVGSNKAVVAARAVWELDPFADVRIWERGLDKRNLREFILGEPRLGVFIDEMDNLSLKMSARILCKKHKIPVVMATDNGDSVLVDVERFDREPDRPIVHGRVESREARGLGRKGFKAWLRLAMKIIGPRFMTERHQESLLEVGRTLLRPPQLGTTASLAGSAVAFVVRRIANKQPMPSGRYAFGLEEKLIRGYDSARQKALRRNKTKKFVREFLKGVV